MGDLFLADITGPEGPEGPQGDPLSAAGRAELISSADLLTGGDRRVPKVMEASPLVAITDTTGNQTFMAARRSDGAPTETAAILIARTLAESGLLGGADLVPELVGGSLYASDPATGKRFLVTATGAPRNAFTANGYIFYTTDSGAFAWNVAQGSVPAAPIMTHVSALGDSLTDSDGWLTSLASATGKTVIDLGVAGQTTTEMGMRFGAVKVGLTVAGNQIPASGPVNVTAMSPTGSWRLPTTVIWETPGTLAGVPGIFRHGPNDGSSLIFTRDTAGPATACPAGTRFVVTAGSKTGVGRESNILTYWGGRNNATSLEVIKHDDELIMAAQRSGIKRRLIFSVTNTSTEPRGSAGYAQVMAINSWRASRWPEAYVDVRRWLIDSALAYMGLTPTAADTTAISEDRIPPQIMTDATHFNQAASTAMGAGLLVPIFQQKGWS